VRLNKYIALHSNLSRRAADEAIKQNRVLVNDLKPFMGQQIAPDDQVMLDDILLNDNEKPITYITILFNKPVGYVCSKDGQGSKTIYELLPDEYSNLNSVGRLDKDSSGLLILTNDGGLHNKLAHPSYKKEKVYEVLLDKSLKIDDELIINRGVKLQDGISKLTLTCLADNRMFWKIVMSEGRNRQIRRTFKHLDYSVTKLHRTQFGSYTLDKLPYGKFKQIESRSS
jgi:23S rRNA pseudouridine2605 synthase